MKLLVTLGIATTLALAMSCGSSDDGDGGKSGTGGSATGGGGGSGGGSGGSDGGSGGGSGGSAGSSAGGAAGNPAGGAAGAGDGGIGDGGGDNCFPCVQANCQSAIDDCNADPDCKEVFECVAACNPPDCTLETCLTSNPTGAATFNSTVLACAQTECANECTFN